MIQQRAWQCNRQIRHRRTSRMSKPTNGYTPNSHMTETTLASRPHALPTRPDTPYLAGRLADVAQVRCTAVHLDVVAERASRHMPLEQERDLQAPHMQASEMRESGKLVGWPTPLPIA